MSKVVKWPEFSNGTGDVFGRSVGGFSSYMSQFDAKITVVFPLISYSIA